MAYLSSDASLIYQKFGVLNVRDSTFANLYGLGVVSLAEGSQLLI
jgi:hypothetical protein